jgi:hypothetical protein
LPLAVTRNRFFEPLCVFCFGMALIPPRGRQVGNKGNRDYRGNPPAVKEGKNGR